MKTKLIEIPHNVEDETKYSFFPEVSKQIMLSFYEEHNDTLQMVKPKDYAAYTYAHTNKQGVIDFCKCKLRIDMPAANTFMIDTAYVKRLQKIVDERQKKFHAKSRGLLIFPVVNEKKIFMINIDKIDTSLKDKQFVNNTYSEKNVKREGSYYYIPRQSMAEFEMPDNIKFYSKEQEKNEIIEKELAKTARNLF